MSTTEQENRTQKHWKPNFRSFIPPDGIVHSYQVILESVTIQAWNPNWEAWDEVTDFISNGVVTTLKLTAALTKVQAIDSHMFGMRSYVFLCFCQLVKMTSTLKKKYSSTYWVFCKWIQMEKDTDHKHFGCEAADNHPAGQEIINKYFNPDNKNGKVLGKMNYRPPVGDIHKTVEKFLMTLSGNIKAVKNGKAKMGSGCKHLFTGTFQYYQLGLPPKKNIKKESEARTKKEPEVRPKIERPKRSKRVKVDPTPNSSDDDFKPLPIVTYPYNMDVVEDIELGPLKEQNDILSGKLKTGDINFELQKVHFFLFLVCHYYLLILLNIHNRQLFG